MLEYPREFFGGVASPDDESIRTIILDLSSQQVHEFSQDNFDFSPLVVNDNIFGGIMKNGEFELWKWTGVGFFEATDEERRALEQQQSSENLSGRPKGTDYYKVRGWSEKSIFNANLRTEKLMADVSTTAFTIVSKKLETLYTIDVLRQGRSPERIWTLQGHPHIVSRVKYRRVFHIS
jgi:hypothetical protein